MKAVYLLAAFTLGFCEGPSVLAQASETPHVVVDQFGYLPNAEKVAVIRDPEVGYDFAQSYSPGPLLEVRDANTQEIVYSGAPEPWENGALHAQPGDRGRWFDFSSVRQAGTYVVFDTGTGYATGPFEIVTGVYDSTLFHAARTFYYNRANLAKEAPYAKGGWTDGASFVGPDQDTEAHDGVPPIIYTGYSFY